MKLNLRIISREFSGMVIDSHLFSDSNRSLLEYPQPLAARLELSEHVLYVCDTDSIQSALAEKNDTEVSFSFLCVGPAPTDFSYSTNCEAIFIDPHVCSLSSAFEKAYRLFQEYSLWEFNLRKLANRHHDIVELLKASIQLFEGDLWVADDDQDIIVCRKEHDCTEAQVFESKACDVLSEKICSHLSNLMSTKEFNLFPQGSCVLEADSGVCMRIVARPYQRVLVLGCCLNQPFVNADSYVSVLALLGQYIELSLSQNSSDEEKNAANPVVFFEKLLDGTFVSSLYLSQCMTTLEWDYNTDEYVCLCIDSAPEKPALSRNDQHRIEQLIHSNFAAQIFPYGDHVAAIINLTKTCIDESQLLNRLESITKTEPIVLGASVPQKSLHRLSDRYHQAYLSFEQGQRKHWPYAVRNFANDILNYAVECVTISMPPESFCPQPLISLIKQDRFNHTEYYHTLKTYLACDCSDTAACKELFLSRNSFRYRLTKIKTITNFDLKDGDTKLLLSFCFKLLDEYGLDNLKLTSFE